MTTEAKQKQDAHPDEQLEREETAELSRCDTFYLLKNLRRRFVLHYLQQHDTAVELGDLTDHVAAWEDGVEIEDLDSSSRKSVYVSLQQSHLPTLADAGVVQYDRAQGTVRLTDRAERVMPYLEVSPEPGVQWSTYYLVLSGASAGLTLLFWLNISPFAAIPASAWMALITGVFASVAIIAWYNDRETSVDYDQPPPEAE